MWSRLCMLPQDVIGNNVFRMLDLLDVVNLDSAVASPAEREHLPWILRSMAPLQAPKLHSSSLDVWNWFWKRGIRLRGLCISHNFAEQWRAIEGNANLIVDGVTIYCKSSAAAEEICQLFKEKSSIMCELVSGFLTLTRFVDEQMLNNFLGHAHGNLKQLNFIGSTTPSSEKWFEQTLLNASFVERLRFEHLRIDKHLGRLTCLRNVKELELETHGVSDEILTTLAIAYPLLEIFKLWINGEHTVTSDGLSAIAHRCAHLKCVEIHNRSPMPAFLLQLALHCPELREIKFPHPPRHSTAISDEVLVALKNNCHHLHTLHCGWNDDVGRIGLYSAHQVLSNLRDLALCGRLYFDSAMLAIALPYLIKLQALKLEVLHNQVCPALLSALSCCGTGDLRSVTFDFDTDPSITLDVREAALVQLVQRNRHLAKVRMLGTSWGTAAVVTHLAAHCPKLQELVLACPPAGIVDDAVVALVQACPRLRKLVGVYGSATTDRTLLAIAQHCPNLQSVLDLRRNVLITAAAVEQMIRQCKRIGKVLRLPNSIPQDERARLWSMTSDRDLPEEFW